MRRGIVVLGLLAGCELTPAPLDLAGPNQSPLVQLVAPADGVLVTERPA